MSASKTRDPFRRSHHQWCTRKEEDRRREAIEFEIPVTRGRSPTTRPCAVCWFVIPNVIDASLSTTECASCHRYLEPMASLRRFSFLRAPLMTRLRNRSLVSDALFLGGLICYRICLIRGAPRLAATWPAPVLEPGKAAIAVRPPLTPTKLLLYYQKNSPTLTTFSRLGRPARTESTSDSDPEWSSYLFVPRRMPWRTQSGLPNPSLWKRARTPPVRSPLAFSRSPLDTLLSGFLLLFLILDDAHLAQIYPWISSLSRLTGCASNPTPLGLLSGWAPLHPGEELYWEEAEKILRWLRQ